jgi:hypothetical protein
VTSAWMEGSLILGIANILLTGVLFAVYRQIYAQTRAAFSLALLMFAGAFVIQNLLVVYSYLATMPLIPDGLSPFLFAIGISEAMGLGAILWTALH